MSFKVIEQFEQAVAQFYGAPYGVAVDCCTHALELCLRMTTPKYITVPKHTYLSVPMTAEKLGIAWDWRDEDWQHFYYLGDTNIIDGAVYFKQGGYQQNSLQCLSFQFKKPLGLGRGGMILCSTPEEYDQLKRMAYDGRDQSADGWWGDQDISTLGYHYYMTPETAQLGLDKLPVVSQAEWPDWSWQNYPDLSLMTVFKNKRFYYV